MCPPSGRICHACDLILPKGMTLMQHNRERHGGPRWGKPHLTGLVKP